LTNATRVWLAAGFVLLAACSKDDDKKPQGTFQVRAAGGTGSTGAGGQGGDLYIESSSGGDVEISKDGALPKIPSFKWLNPSLGSNPLTVTTNTTVTPDGSQRVLGDDGATTATGLWVKAGATLTLEPNYDWDGIAGNETAYLYLDEGVLVEGTIVTGPKNGAGPDAAQLYLYATTIVIAKTGRVDTSGDDVAAGDGGDAGYLRLGADGSAFSEGTLLARGGRGTTSGGSGNGIGLYGDWGMAVHTGEMDASGGDASDGQGGGAGWAEVSVDDLGTALNSGTMRARGGNGTTGGGSGGWLYVENYDRGPAYSTGELDGAGGNASVDGSGGEGGGVYVEAYGADAVLGGTVSVHGGHGAGSGNGGWGGDVDLYNWDTWGENAIVPAGRIVLGADLDVSGGNGVNGGGGGYVDVETGSERPSSEQPQIRFVGFAAIDVSGGHGGSDGGYGGDVEVYAYPSAPYAGTQRHGSILNEASITGRGGDATTGSAAGGGYVELSGYGEFDGWDLLVVAAEPGSTSNVTNQGEIDVGGGNGVSGAGNGGDVYLSAYGDVRNEASLRSNGGNSGSWGGYGGYVELYGDAAVTSDAALFANGGTGTDGNGGSGGSVWLYGERAICRDIAANGGASTAAAGGHGGDAGVGSAFGSSSFGTFSVVPGTGAPAGDVGYVWVDGFQVALTDGKYKR
jgi:hypothetical protein